MPATLEKVAVCRKSLSAYRGIVGRAAVESVRRSAKTLLGARVSHINSTARGGGVAEILQTLVSLQRDVGINADWHVVHAPARFFSVTKNIHNALQGGSRITKSECEYYLETNKRFASLLDALDADLLVIHDPQPLAALSFMAERRPAISRIHIDLSSPNGSTLSFVKPFLREYDRVVFSLRAFVPKGLPPRKVAIIPPAIDPLARKNKKMNERLARIFLYHRFGISPVRPLVAQVSRFDRWKDPIGVIDAYRIAKRSFPDLQLALVGNGAAKDDPEGKRMFQEVRKHARGESGVFLLFLPPGRFSNDAVVNAVQSSADVIFQKSVREGFGLTATEAMWKERAVVAGDVGGLAFQIEDGKSGILVSSPREAAHALVSLLRNPARRRELGREARKRVESNFLITRLLADHLALYNEVLSAV